MSYLLQNSLFRPCNQIQHKEYAFAVYYNMWIKIVLKNFQLQFSPAIFAGTLNRRLQTKVWGILWRRG